MPFSTDNFGSYLTRYRNGEWRDRLFRDMIFEDVQPEGRDLVFLDIGCGRGLDGDVPLQRSIYDVAGTFIGVEPDTEIVPEIPFHGLHQCTLEQAPLQPGSIAVAYSVMVLEHLQDPELFWNKLYDSLQDRGVFWGMTVDKRHWFCACSAWAETLKVKDLYLRALYGERGTDRYENYPVFYRSNTPQDIDRLTQRFRKRDFFNLSRVGQCNAYLPSALRPLGTFLDKRAIRQEAPGSLLIVRLEK